MQAVPSAGCLLFLGEMIIAFPYVIDAVPAWDCRENLCWVCACLSYRHYPCSLIFPHKWWWGQHEGGFYGLPFLSPFYHTRFFFPSSPRHSHHTHGCFSSLAVLLSPDGFCIQCATWLPPSFCGSWVIRRSCPETPGTSFYLAPLKILKTFSTVLPSLLSLVFPFSLLFFCSPLRFQ